MKASDTSSLIHLDLSDARVRLRLELPSGWSWESVPPPTRVDREGRLPVRLLATRDLGGVGLRISATYLRLPLGLPSAVAYWCALCELPVPNLPVQWGDYEAFVANSANSAAPFICMVWMRMEDSIVELRVEAQSSTLRDELVEWLQTHFEFESTGAVDTQSPEPWWDRVTRLRERGLIEEAIKVAELEGDRAEAFIVQANLHVERMRRAKAAGQLEIAREAWQSASASAHAYAASSTSGGEGAARSVERDRVLAELGPEPT